MLDKCYFICLMVNDAWRIDLNLFSFNLIPAGSSNYPGKLGSLEWYEHGD